MADCEECGRPKKRAGRWCSGCYQRRYRLTDSGRRKHNDAVIRYNARYPVKRREWVHRYQERVGIRVPDLQTARRAIKRLEQALAAATLREGVRGAGERNGDGGPEW